MSTRPKLLPSDAHPITIASNPNRLVVQAGDGVIADTRWALTLSEAKYPPVEYIPRDDVDMAQLRRSDHASYCPYKGDASYFDVPALGEAGVNAVWSYEQPFDAVSAIAGHLAFYPDRVKIQRRPR